MAQLFGAFQEFIMLRLSSFRFTRGLHRHQFSGMRLTAVSQCGLLPVRVPL